MRFDKKLSAPYTVCMAKKKKPPRPASVLADALIAAIERDERTIYAIGKEAGLSPGMLNRFVSRDRDLSLIAASKLATTLGLRLVRG